MRSTGTRLPSTLLLRRALLSPRAPLSPPSCSGLWRHRVVALHHQHRGAGSSVAPASPAPPAPSAPSAPSASSTSSSPLSPSCHPPQLPCVLTACRSSRFSCCACVLCSFLAAPRFVSSSGLPLGHSSALSPRQPQHKLRQSGRLSIRFRELTVTFEIPQSYTVTFEIPQSYEVVRSRVFLARPFLVRHQRTP